MNRSYTYEFIGSASAGSGGAVEMTADGVSLAATASSQSAASGTTAMGGAAKRLGSAAMSQVISPLNQATGGLASPAYNLGKSILTGASAAVIGAGVVGVAIAAAMYGIQKISERMDKIESAAAAANENEVLLLKAGRINQASTYEADFIKGVQKVNRG